MDATEKRPAVKVLGVSGSMRRGSFSRIAVETALKMAGEFGAETRFVDLYFVDLPMYRPDGSITSPAIESVAEAVAWADAFLLSTPDYHGSMSGAMKNFLDYHWEEFAGKLFGYLCASHEKGLTVMDHVRTAVRQCYGWSVPYGVSIHGKQDCDESGAITNAQLLGRMRMLARDLVVYAPLVRKQFLRDLAEREPNTFAARFGT